MWTRPNFCSWKLYEEVKAVGEFFGGYKGTLKELLDLFPFYTQCFLIAGMSFERWLFVCRPICAQEFFKKRSNKLLFYCGISAVALSVPTLLFVDYVATQGFQV